MEKTTIKLSPANIEERKALDIRAGDIVRVSQKIVEKGKTRIQIFEGMVLAIKHGKESGGTFTVRKVMSGVGVEKIYPIYSPSIDKVEVVKRSKVKRAKLYFIREKVTREIRHKMRKMLNLPTSKTAKMEDYDEPEEVAAVEETKD
jgi:large subunit ribosomal protein L19